MDKEKGCVEKETNSHTHTRWQVQFPVYLANMLKTMRGDSMDLVCKLQNEGAPNAFRSEPVASIKDWSQFRLSIGAP